MASDELLRAAARVAIVDSATAEVVRALRSAGLRSIVLKGPGFAAWLYDGASLRSYGDIDLLVAPSDRPQVESVLRELGYVRTLGDGEVPLPGRELHADTWWSRRSGSSVDLHRTLGGARAPAARAWAALSRDTEWLKVGTVQVEIPSIPARALHASLHAAHHGALSGKPLVYLERALERADDDVWAQAADLALELDALEPFSAGLRLLPTGRALAARLDLDAPRSVEVLLKAADDRPLAASFEWLVQARGTRAKVRLVRELLVPEPAWVRASYPFARRSRRGLMAAYLVRLTRIPRYGLQALVAWRRARRDARAVSR